MKTLLDRDPTELFNVKDQPAVSRHLTRHAELSGFLIQCHQKVSEHFGPNTASSLELFSDPESGDQKLFVMISTQQSVNDARERLNRLDQDWLIDVPAELLSKVNIDVEYV